MSTTDRAKETIDAPARRRRSVAVAGASGYVGRALTGRLAADGQAVVALGRKPQDLPQGAGIERRSVDVANQEATIAALDGVGVAYYLVHALADAERFRNRDRAMASSFAQAARRAGVERIVYLGGLGGEGVSAHLASRHEVGAILADSGVDVVELRAAVVLGAGSISFEMLRYLTERLPVMVCPRWIDTRLQPIAERDLIEYLIRAPTVHPGTYEIGSPEVTTYGQMIQTYAEVRGLRPRAILRVPLLTPSLSSRWVDLVAPVDRRVSHSLIESLRSEVVVTDAASTQAAFGLDPVPVADAIKMALDDQRVAVTDSLLDGKGGLRDGVYTMRTAVVLPSPNGAAVRDDLARVGGDLRWYGLAWLWWLRLLLGRLFGERLAVRAPDSVKVGATVDWWTVARSDDTSLVLVADWKLGDAWLGYRVVGGGRHRRRGAARMEQVAAFRARGVIGLLYWRALWPVHWLVFRGMTRHRVRSAGTTPSRTARV